MNIKNYLLTDVNVKRYPNVDFERLLLNFEKQSSMPAEIENGDLKCKIIATVTLQNEKKEDVLNLSVAYFIDCDSVFGYEQEKTSTEVFSKMAFVYFEKINSLLKDFNFAPMPISIIES